MIIEDWAEWYFGSGLGLAFERGSDCIVLPMSVKDRLLHWVQGRSQTYYPEHILVYGYGKTHCSLIMGSDSF